MSHSPQKHDIQSAIRRWITSPGLWSLLKFLAAGGPSFLIALPLNCLLIERCGWPKPAAYALVLCFQVVINFFICTFVVFRRDVTKSLWAQFFVFMAGILSTRLLDWALFSIITHFFPHYLVVQIFNVVLFSLTKYAFAKRTIEGANS
jgi:putative flippase GtrA